MEEEITQEEKEELAANLVELEELQGDLEEKNKELDDKIAELQARIEKLGLLEEEE